VEIISNQQPEKRKEKEETLRDMGIIKFAPRGGMRVTRNLGKLNEGGTSED